MIDLAARRARERALECLNQDACEANARAERILKRVSSRTMAAVRR